MIKTNTTKNQPHFTHLIKYFHQMDGQMIDKHYRSTRIILNVYDKWDADNPE